MNLRDLVEQPPAALRQLGAVWCGLGFAGGLTSAGFSWLFLGSDEYRHQAAGRVHQLTVKGVIVFVSGPQTFVYYLSLYLFFSVFVLIVVTKVLALVFGDRSNRAG